MTVTKQLTISSWNVHGLGDKLNDPQFLEHLTSDIIILIETWKGATEEFIIPGYNVISKVRKKRKKARRYSGGIIVSIKKQYFKGITYLQHATNSQNRMWLKLDKYFFGLQEDIYICALYIPPLASTHYDNDLISIENESCSFANKGKIILIGDFNSRTADRPDYILNDASQINNFDGHDLLPENYKPDTELERINQDHIINIQGNNLLELCLSSRLRILNGRFLGDSLGYYTYMSSNGFSTVDYAIVSESLLPSVKFFKTGDFTYLSDHVQIELYISCYINFETKRPLDEKKWHWIKSYKWTDKSKDLLINALLTENIKNEVIDFELETYVENQEGVDGATKKLTNILHNCSTMACKVTSINFKKKKNKHSKYRQIWSDNVVHETKRQINNIGKKIKHNPNEGVMKQKYFELCKTFKKMVKQKKYEYKQKICKSLSDNINKNPKEYWNVLKSLKKKPNIDEEIPDILRNEDSIIKHFQEQGCPSSINEDFMKKIENELKILEKNIAFRPETDAPVTCSEVKKAINNLKLGKSTGPDRILNEVIKYSHKVLVKSYVKIYNLILNTGCYPESWKKSFIISLHKTGDKSDPNNYRGISLSNSLPKIFNAVLNNRLIKVIDSQLSNSQFGFRENHRTADSIFVLKSLINKYIHKGKGKIYACFVDLKKAFDSVWRTALLYKLCNMGVGKTFYRVIKQQYINTKSSLKYKEYISDYFHISRGVKQGDSLSPTLFNIFINDITKNFEDKQSTPLQLIDSKIGSLLFADDLLILSETKEGLQNSLNNLSTYCDNWQLSLNINKTKTMIFTQSKHKIEQSFVTYKNKAVDNTTEYSFLGILIKNNGNLSQSTLNLTKKAKKVFFAIRSYTNSLNNLPLKVANNLFDSLVKPVMTYNAEITYLDSYISLFRAKQRAASSGKEIDTFNFIDKTPFENLHLSFCKYILGTRKNASNLATRVEVGRFPIEYFIKTQTILYLARLFTQNINPLLRESFLLTQQLDITGTYSWYTYAKNIADEAGIDLNKLESTRDIKQIKTINMYIKSKFKTYYENLITEKFDKIDDKSKLNLYKSLKQFENMSSEMYLSNNNFEYRKMIAKLRISDHNLLIEKGRHLKLPRNERLCQKCKVVEDEKHFILHCSNNSNLRVKYFMFLYTQNNDFINYVENEKLHYILNPSTHTQVNKLGSFIKKSLELRTGDS